MLLLGLADNEHPGACYNLQYLDKTLVNYANVMGLKDDTNSMHNLPHSLSRYAVVPWGIQQPDVSTPSHLTYMNDED